MSKSQVIGILFDDNSENIFKVGQLVTGHVHVQTSERIKIRGILFCYISRVKALLDDYSQKLFNFALKLLSIETDHFVLKTIKL